MAITLSSIAPQALFAIAFATMRSAIIQLNESPACCFTNGLDTVVHYFAICLSRSAPTLPCVLVRHHSITDLFSGAGGPTGSFPGVSRRQGADALLRVLCLEWSALPRRGILLYPNYVLRALILCPASCAVLHKQRNRSLVCSLLLVLYTKHQAFGQDEAEPT